jgi:ATP-dependent DNA ligase
LPALESSVQGLELVVAFQHKKPAAIGVKAPFPGFIEPALATTIERVPGGQRWVHEIKLDGYRTPVISETPQSRFDPL